MIYELSQHVSDYFWDVFVNKADFWLLFGFLSQLVFTARFLVQWIASERAGQSVVPLAFWVLSLVGGVMTLVYGIVRREPVIIMGQLLSIFIYLRNLVLILGNKSRER